MGGKKDCFQGLCNWSGICCEERGSICRYLPIQPEQREAEIARFEAAVEKAQEDLLVLAEKSEIFAAHYALAGDIAIHDGVTGKIRDQLMNAEAALMQTRDEFVMVFESMEDEYMRERAADMRDVSGRLLFAMKGIDDNPFQE